MQDSSGKQQQPVKAKAQGPLAKEKAKEPPKQGLFNPADSVLDTTQNENQSKSGQTSKDEWRKYTDFVMPPNAAEQAWKQAQKYAPPSLEKLRTSDAKYLELLDRNERQYKYLQDNPWENIDLTPLAQSLSYMGGLNMKDVDLSPKKTKDSLMKQREALERGIQKLRGEMTEAELQSFKQQLAPPSYTGGTRGSSLEDIIGGLIKRQEPDPNRGRGSGVSTPKPENPDAYQKYVSELGPVIETYRRGKDLVSKLKSSKSDISGVGISSYLPSAMLSQEGKDIRQIAQDLILAKIYSKEGAGKQVSDKELAKNMERYGLGKGQSDANFLVGVEKIIKEIEDNIQTKKALLLDPSMRKKIESAAGLDLDTFTGSQITPKSSTSLTVEQQRARAKELQQKRSGGK